MANHRALFIIVIGTRKISLERNGPLLIVLLSVSGSKIVLAENGSEGKATLLPVLLVSGVGHRKKGGGERGWGVGRAGGRSSRGEQMD